MNNTVDGAEEASALTTEQSEALREYFVKEIQSMMHGFGDNQFPLTESATLVETIVKQQMKSILNQATEVAEMRGAKCVGPEDILFLMRKDKIKFYRLLKYLEVKDLKGSVTGMTDPEEMFQQSTNKKYSSMCTEFLKLIDQTGELSDKSNLPPDIVKYERNVRAERSSRNMDESQYFDFVNARRTSFVSSKSINKFREWLKLKPDGGVDTLKFTNVTYDLLGYLAYETVAQIVDLSLLVRQDAMRRSGDPFNRYLPDIGYSTQQNMETQLIETASPLTPTEIREAVRRYWTSPIGPSYAFTRHSPDAFHNRLLSC